MKRTKDKNGTQFEVIVTLRNGNSPHEGTPVRCFISCWAALKAFTRLLHANPAKYASYQIFGGLFDKDPKPNMVFKIHWAKDTRGMRRVSKEEFYNTVGNMDVILSVRDEHGYPYSVDWKLRNGTLKGKTVDKRDEKRPGFTVTDYFVSA